MGALLPLAMILVIGCGIIAGLFLAGLAVLHPNATRRARIAGWAHLAGIAMSVLIIALGRTS